MADTNIAEERASAGERDRERKKRTSGGGGCDLTTTVKVVVVVVLHVQGEKEGGEQLHLSALMVRQSLTSWKESEIDRWKVIQSFQ